VRILTEEKNGNPVHSASHIKKEVFS